MSISQLRKVPDVLPSLRQWGVFQSSERLPRPRRQRGRRGLLVLAAVLLLTAGFWLLPTFLENFWVVIPDCAYRSSQLTVSALEHYTREHGIRSVINLRGSNPDHVWYWDEREAAARLGLEHYNLSIDSRYPYPEELRELIETLENCARPVLFHCNSGVDRTGTAAAIAILLLEKQASLADAEQHFGVRYLQIPWRSNALGQRYFVDFYRQWLSQHNQAHNPARFRYWALHCYERPPEPPSPDQR